MSEMYTERLLDHYRNPRNQGHLDSPDLMAEEYNLLCGDRVRIEARMEAGRIVAVRFDGRDRALCLAASSIVTETIQGRNLDELRSLGKDEFLVELQSEPRPSRLKCALLPWRPSGARPTARMSGRCSTAETVAFPGKALEPYCIAYLVEQPIGTSRQTNSQKSGLAQAGEL